MKLLVIGNEDYILIPETIQETVKEIESKSGKQTKELVVRKPSKGQMNGIDQSAMSWANSKNIPIRSFYKNNVTMAEYCDVCLVIWNGKCPKIKKAVKIVESMNKPVYHKFILEEQSDK